MLFWLTIAAILVMCYVLYAGIRSMINPAWDVKKGGTARLSLPHHSEYRRMIDEMYDPNSGWSAQRELNRLGKKQLGDGRMSKSVRELSKL